jgi:hypothetical protein
VDRLEPDVDAVVGQRDECGFDAFEGRVLDDRRVRDEVVRRWALEHARQHRSV